MVFEHALTEYLVDGLRDALSAPREFPPTTPMPVDQYIAMSALQKAIRRDRPDVALSAAWTLMRANPRGLWRRLGVIAFEDIGIANIDIVGWVVVVMTDKRRRADLGGDERILKFLVSEMCTSRKDRSTDDLLIAAMPYRDSGIVDELIPMTPSHRIASDINVTRSLEERAIAAWLAIGTDKIEDDILPRVSGCIDGYFDTLAVAGVPRTSVEIGRLGFRRAGTILPVLFPLLHQEAGNCIRDINDDDVPEECMIGSVPSWALDLFTRRGLAAYALYAKRSDRFRGYLRRAGTDGTQAKRIVGNLMFRVEGGLVRNRIQWPEAQRLRETADTIGNGVSPEAVAEGMALVREEIGLINECRHEITEGVGK